MTSHDQTRVVRMCSSQSLGGLSFRSRIYCTGFRVMFRGWHLIAEYVQLFYIMLFGIVYYCGRVEGICPQPVFQAPPPRCPGETAVFACQSDDSARHHRTVWEVNEEGAPYGGCPLLHYLWPNATTNCGSFHGKSTVESPSKCFVSEFSVTATVALNGTSVICHYVDGVNNQVRGSAPLQVTGPIKTAISTVEKSDVTFGDNSGLRSAMIHWTTSHTRNVTRYVVKVNPAAAPCDDSGGGVGECVISAGSDGFESRELSLQLELGIEYTVTVSTVNCGTQAGDDSDPVSVLLHYPAIPQCQTHAHYQNGSLFLIEITWDNKLSDYTDHDTLLEVDLYSLIINPVITYPVGLPSLTSCTTNRCSYMFNVTSFQSNLTVANMSVMLTASNTVGESQPASCNAYPIDSEGFVTVDSTTGPHVSILIQFPLNTTMIHCTLMYGPNSTFLHSSANIREKHNGIEYQPHPLVTGVLYHYNVSCSMSDQRFTARGLFTPGCFLVDLIPEGHDISSINPLCLELPNGLVCYNDLLPGAVAVYVCWEDSTLQGDSSRVCGSSGVWSGQIPLCEANIHPNSSMAITTTATPTIATNGIEWDNKGSDGKGVRLPITTVVAVPVSAGIALCITSCLIGALLHKTMTSYCYKRATKQSKSHTTPPHLYDEVIMTSSSLHQSVPHCSTDECRREIITNPNEAYVDSKPFI